MPTGGRGKRHTRLLNRTPRWVLEGLEHLCENPPDEPQPTAFFRSFCIQWREDHLDKYRYIRHPPRDFDGTPNDYAALLRRLGWTNLKTGTRRSAVWELS